MKNQIGGAYRVVRKVVSNPGLVLPLKQPMERVPTVADDRFVFIGGLHRSGTSILHRLLREHEDTTGFTNTRVPEDEGQYLQSIFERDGNHGGPGQFAFDIEAHLTEKSDLVSPDNRATLLRQWGAYLDLDKRIILEKSPANFIRSRFFQALFPAARFIFIVRHPIPVSLSTHNWTRRDGIGLDRVLRHWVRAQKVFLGDLPHVDNHLLIRYEDMIANPTATLETVQRFIGLKPTSVKEQVGDQNKKYFGRWEETIDKKDSLIGEFNKVGGAAMAERFGYSMHAPYVPAAGEWHLAEAV